MVVTSPGRQRISNPQGNKGSSQSGLIAPPTHGSPRRRLSVPPESSNAKHDLQRDSKSHSETERQSSGKPKKDQDVESKRRGHHIEGTSKTSTPKVAARRPLRKDSRDTSKDNHSPRSSANKTSQPPTDPSTPGPSKASAKPRVSKHWNPLRIPT